MVAARETVSPFTFLYWFQVVFGVLAGVLGTVLWRRVSGGALGLPGVLALVGLVVLSFVFVVYLMNLHKRPLVPDYSRTCYSCRLPVNRWSEFCEHCGADLVERHKIFECPECQAEVYKGVRYCPSCGHDFGP